jgi:hypothetical protein
MGSGDLNEWVLDASFDPPIFCPYERETDEVVIGLGLISGRAPGQLVGVIHSDGQGAVEAWIGAHPNWTQDYGVAGTPSKDTP